MNGRNAVKTWLKIYKVLKALLYTERLKLYYIYIHCNN